MAGAPTLFFDIGGVLLTNGWDTPARKLAAEHFGLDYPEFQTRHEMLKTGFETGRLTLGAYLHKAVFFRHRPLHAVMHIQGAKKVDPLPGAAPPPPAADPAQPAKYVVLRRDLGALRQPPVVMTVAFSILFALSLYVMHNMERTQQQAARADLEPTPAPVPG